MSVVARLQQDLQRPAGGWTVGILTIGLAATIPIFAVVGVWPGPQWTANVATIGLLAAHMLWGAAGYYPARMVA